MARKQKGSRTLKEFLLLLEREGELRRIPEMVDPKLEAAAIAVRSMREGGPALLFENIRGSSVPLAMNILASDRRVELAIGEDAGELGHQLLTFVEQLMPPKPYSILRGVKPLFNRLVSARIKQKRSTELSPSEQTLSSLPILKTWPDDGGKFITLPQVITYDPSTGKRNVGMYRMHVFGPMETGMHWQIQKGGGFHYNVAESLNRPLEVAVAVGTDPCFLLATIAPLPEGIDEMAFAGFLRGSPMRVRKGSTISIDIPAEAEFVLEGKVRPHKRRIEGPFGDHFGHYSHAGMFPIFEISAIQSRRDSIFAATVVGKPPMEDKWLGDATQLILGPLARLTHPEVADVWAFYEAGFHNLLGVRTNQRYGKESMKTALSIATDGQLSLTKCAIVVSEGVDNRNFRSILRAIKENFDPRYDVTILQNVPLDTLDFTSYTMNLGSKILLDGTRKLSTTASGGAYGARRNSELLAHVGEREAKDLREIDSRITSWKVFEDVLLVVRVAGAFTASENAAIHLESAIVPPTKTVGREVIERLVSSEKIQQLPKGIKIVTAVSEDVNLMSDMEVVWGIFTRFDAARDVCFTETSLVGVTALYEGVMGIDATWKFGYPNPCELP